MNSLEIEDHQDDSEENSGSENYSDDSPPAGIKGLFWEIAKLTRFTGHFFKEFVRFPYEFNEIVKQSYLVGYKSLPLVGVTSFIMGLVLTLQSQPVMKKFGAEAWLPSMVGISIFREIGPVITALICAGKVGSGIGAELASMKVTEQIEAMEVSGTNPFKYLAFSRIVATTLMLPILVSFADCVGVFGSYVGMNLNDNINFQLFFLQVFNRVDFIDVLPAFIKSFLFGFIIGLIGSYKGFNSSRGTEGVGKAANSAVVLSSLLIFIVDMMAVQVTNLFM
jgi:phospholipid/cholesterol/gamma-HCH transport system permease protein